MPHTQKADAACLFSCIMFFPWSTRGHMKPKPGKPKCSKQTRRHFVYREAKAAPSRSPPKRSRSLKPKTVVLKRSTKARHEDPVFISIQLKGVNKKNNRYKTNPEDHDRVIRTKNVVRITHLTIVFWQNARKRQNLIVYFRTRSSPFLEYLYSLFCSLDSPSKPIFTAFYFKIKSGQTDCAN